MIGFDQETVEAALSRPTGPDLLPVLRLRRQAAARGWRLTRVTKTSRETVFHYEHPTDETHDGGWVRVRTGSTTGPVHEWMPARLAVNTCDGMLVAEHVDTATAVRLLYAYTRWPTPAADPVPWPPKTGTPAPVAVGGAL